MPLRVKKGLGGDNAYTKKRRRKTARIATVVTAILFLLLLGAGIFYTWYMGRNKPAEVKELSTQKLVNPLPKTSKPNENTPIGIGLQTFTSPVVRGKNSSIGIRTTPTAACSIHLEYDGLASKDTGLIPKVADEFGSVSWTWTVEASRPVGKWPVEIVCAYNGRSAYYRADLVVQAVD